MFVERGKGESEMPLYHVSRLGQGTLDQIYQIVSITPFTYSYHASQQKMLKSVADWEYIAEHGTVIELNYSPDDGSHKALLRTPDGHCAVFGLGTKQIVTMWYNSPTDNHATLDASRYDGGVKV